MTFESHKRAAAIAVAVLAGAWALWWVFTPTRVNDSPLPPPASEAGRTPAATVPGSAETAPPAPASARRPLPKLPADLLQAHRAGDRVLEDRLFSELQKRLLRADSKDAGLVVAVVDLIHDGTVDNGLRLGLVQALIQGASSGVIPRIVELYHSTNDREIKMAILQKLPDIQGDARLIDQGVNVTPALVAAFSGEPDNSALLGPLAVALTKMGDAQALGFLIDQVTGRATTLEAIRTSGDVRLQAAVSAIVDNAIPSDAAVPYLTGRLAAAPDSPVESGMIVMTLASIGSPGAIKGLLSHYKSAPDNQAEMASSALSRLSHPDTLELLQASLKEDRFRSAAVKRAVELAVADLKP